MILDDIIKKARIVSTNKYFRFVCAILVVGFVYTKMPKDKIKGENEDKNIIVRARDGIFGEIAKSKISKEKQIEEIKRNAKVRQETLKKKEDTFAKIKDEFKDTSNKNTNKIKRGDTVKMKFVAMDEEKKMLLIQEPMTFEMVMDKNMLKVFYD